MFVQVMIRLFTKARGAARGAEVASDWCPD